VGIHNTSSQADIAMQMLRMNACKWNDFKCNRKPTYSRLSLTHHANKSSRYARHTCMYKSACQKREDWSSCVKSTSCNDWTVRCKRHSLSVFVWVLQQSWWYRRQLRHASFHFHRPPTVHTSRYGCYSSEYQQQLECHKHYRLCQNGLFSKVCYFRSTCTWRLRRCSTYEIVQNSRLFGPAGMLGDTGNRSCLMPKTNLYNVKVAKRIRHCDRANTHSSVLSINGVCGFSRR